MTREYRGEELKGLLFFFVFWCGILVVILVYPHGVVWGARDVKETFHDGRIGCKED